MSAGRAGALPRSLAGFRGLHAGETIVVCGCGASLNRLREPGRFVTVGVNDVGRLFDPTYLVVLNPRQQFRPGRFRHVEHSRARAVFTQLDLGLSHPCVVRFRLGERGGTDLSDPSVLPYTRNSPYVALCLAAHLGARRIGLIGVDFTDHHFFAATGVHPLSRQLGQIDGEYRRLGRALAEAGVEVVNLSAESRLTAFPKLGQDAFEAGEPAAPSRDGRPPRAAERRVSRRRTPMRLAIETRSGDLSGGLLRAFADTARELGHQVVGPPVRQGTRADVVSIVWNGRHHRSSGPTLYCEHGWLPRLDYQVSPRGINADHDAAPFRWQGPPAEAVLERARAHLETLRRGGDCRHEYMRTDRRAAEDLPESFLLVPLQIEQDTNIVRHVPSGLRSMQALIDRVSAADLPLPVLFKQHPADQRRGNRHLALRVRRRQDRIRPHDLGNVHQILKSGACRGILALNSNVVHDGLIWGVPAIVLGRNVWPRKGRSPFFLGMPRIWGELEAFAEDPETLLCQLAYVDFLRTHQWTLADARDPERIEALLRRCRARSGRSRVAVSKLGPAESMPCQIVPAAGARRRVPTRPSPLLVVNVVARDHGWLLEDLKGHFASRAPAGLRVRATERPLPRAEAWVFLRTQEASATPDPERTLVQIHDLWDDGLYRTGGRRRSVAACGAVTLTHPDQAGILEASGIPLARKTVIERPLGAAATFRPRPASARPFTLGWVGRPVVRHGRDVKRALWLAEALERLADRRREIEVLLLGERLDEVHRRIRGLGFACSYHRRAENPYETYPRHYRELDALVITAEAAAGPNCLFEALASGVPVVATPAGWAPTLIREGQNGFLARSPDEIAAAIERIRGARPEWAARRETISAAVARWSLESWIDENLQAALALAGLQAAA